VAGIEELVVRAARDDLAAQARDGVVVEARAAVVANVTARYLGADRRRTSGVPSCRGQRRKVIGGDQGLSEPGEHLVQLTENQLRWRRDLNPDGAPIICEVNDQTAGDGFHSSAAIAVSPG
jgi:hypothetical protein